MVGCLFLLLDGEERVFSDLGSGVSSGVGVLDGDLVGLGGGDL